MARFTCAINWRHRINRVIKLLYLVTEDWYFCSHRLALARAARDSGYQVCVATRVSRHGEVIRGEGFKLLSIGMRRGGTRPFHELSSVGELYRIYRREQPDIVHQVAMKPVIYGSIVSRLSSIPVVINALGGLGFLFTSTGARARFLRPWVRLALRRVLSFENATTIVQNSDDREVLSALSIPPRKLQLIRGSGVDIDQYRPTPEPDGEIVVSFVSRMLWDKGVGELVEAARLLRGEGIRIRLVGAPDPENPASVSRGQLSTWQREGVVEWNGHSEDIAKIWRDSAIAVLPSHREGLPKALLEAAACGRPVITTDVPGCRDVVECGVSGLLVKVNDPVDLASQIRRLANDRSLRIEMGKAGRALVEREFSQQRVVAATLDLYRKAIETVSVR